jgi:SAM-dependent methyltransferase
MENKYKTPHNFYSQYFESIYSSANNLSVEQFELTAAYFGVIYHNYMPSNKNAVILDLGCGAGHFLYFLKKLGYCNYAGIDISPQQVEFCNANITSHVEVADAFQFLQGKSEAYDLIVAHDVLEHIHKDRVLLLVKNIYSSLRKGGIFIVRVPNMSNPLAVHARYVDLSHEIGFTESSLKQLLFVGGFRDIQLIGALVMNRRTFRSYLRRIFLRMYNVWVKFLYYVQDFSVPRILDHNLIAICNKNYDM